MNRLRRFLVLVMKVEYDPDEISFVKISQNTVHATIAIFLNLMLFVPAVCLYTRCIWKLRFCRNRIINIFFIKFYLYIKDRTLQYFSV